MSYSPENVPEGTDIAQLDNDLTSGEAVRTLRKHTAGHYFYASLIKENNGGVQ